MGLFYLLVAVMPLERSRLLEHFFSGVSVIKYLGFACLVLALVTAGKQRLGPALRQPACGWFLALAAWALLSQALLGPAFSWGLSPGASYLSFLMLLPIVVLLVNSARRLQATLWAMAAGMGVTSLYVLREWQRHRGEASFRPGWIAGDPNYFTIAAVLILPLAWSLRQRSRKPGERRLLLAAMLVIAAATLLAASRGGFLGLSAGALWLAWHSRRRTQALCAGLALLPLLLLSARSPLLRLLHPSAGDRTAVEKREIVWRAGLRMLAAHPLAGVGLGNFKLQVANYENGSGGGATVSSIAHNTYLEIAVELGLPGLAAWLLLWIASWRSLERSRRRAPPESLVRASAEGLQAGLLGYAVSMFFLSAEYQKLLWLALFLALALPPLAARVAEPARQAAA